MIIVGIVIVSVTVKVIVIVIEIGLCGFTLHLRLPLDFTIHCRIRFRLPRLFERQIPSDSQGQGQDLSFKVPTFRGLKLELINVRTKRSSKLRTLRSSSKQKRQKRMNYK